MAKTVLLIGDFHIPRRADSVPEEFMEDMRRADVVLCTGDITSEGIVDRMMDISERVHAVGGEEDHMELPEQDLVDVEDLSFGLIHGHQFEGGDVAEDSRPGDGEGQKNGRDRVEKITEYGKLLRVDVLVTGHTHSPFEVDKEDVILLNPGSATGAEKDGEENSETCIKMKIDRRDISDVETVSL